MLSWKETETVTIVQTRAEIADVETRITLNSNNNNKRKTLPPPTQTTQKLSIPTINLQPRT
jgi:hypothetical protein